MSTSVLSLFVSSSKPNSLELFLQQRGKSKCTDKKQFKKDQIENLTDLTSYKEDGMDLEKNIHR